MVLASQGIIAGKCSLAIVEQKVMFKDKLDLVLLMIENKLSQNPTKLKMNVQEYK